MNTWSRSRNGTRNLNRSLNRTLDHDCNRFGSAMLGGARRPRRPDLLSLACGLIAPARVSTLWTDRYFPPPKQRRIFLKWFNEKHPSR